MLEPTPPICLRPTPPLGRRVRLPRNIRFETRLEIAGETIVSTPNLDTFSKALPAFCVLQTVLMNDFCGSILDVCEHDISLVLIGYIHRLCRHLHQLPFSMSLSTAASRRASRPLCLATAFFVSATISAAVFPPLPFCICVFFFLGCLSEPRVRFLPGSRVVAVGC